MGCTQSILSRDVDGHDTSQRYAQLLEDGYSNMLLVLNIVATGHTELRARATTVLHVCPRIDRFRWIEDYDWFPTNYACYHTAEAKERSEAVTREGIRED